MKSRIGKGAIAIVVLGLTGCPQVDPGYVRAMEEWADRSCDCYSVPESDRQKCFAAVQEPQVPSHFLDAAVDNPNYEAAEPAKKQVEACLKAWREREGVKVN